MSISYEFDEVALVPGAYLFAAGRAVIGYDTNGAWAIDDILFDGPAGSHVPCLKDGPDFARIAAVLETKHAVLIEDAIRQDVEDAREADVWTMAEERAERRAA